MVASVKRRRGAARLHEARNDAPASTDVEPDRDGTDPITARLLTVITHHSVALVSEQRYAMIVRSALGPQRGTGAGASPSPAPGDADGG